MKTEAELPPPPPPTRPTAVGYEEFPPGLTPRETDILRLATAGLDNQQISQRLQTSLRNVEKYILRLQTKIDSHGQGSPWAQMLKTRGDLNAIDGPIDG